jgi:hypothetical protein
MTLLHNPVQTGHVAVVPRISCAALCLPARIGMTSNDCDRHLSIVTPIDNFALLKNGESFHRLVPSLLRVSACRLARVASAWDRRSLFEAECNHHGNYQLLLNDF